MSIWLINTYIAKFSFLSCILQDMDKPFGLLLMEEHGYLKEDTGIDCKSDIKSCKHLIGKGSLLTVFSDVADRSAGSPHNYKYVSGDLTLTLHCKPDQVHPLTKKQRDLLEGVEREADRITVLYNLDWVEKLELQSYVYVTTPTILDPVKGVIHYIGSPMGQTGIKFGVELLVSVY